MKSKAQFKVVEDSVRRQLPKHVFFFYLQQLRCTYLDKLNCMHVIIFDES